MQAEGEIFLAGLMFWLLITNKLPSGYYPMMGEGEVKRPQEAGDSRVELARGGVHQRVRRVGSVLGFIGTSSVARS